MRLLLKSRRPSTIAVMPVVYDTFWLRKGYDALTFFGTIITSTADEASKMADENNVLRRHETIHLRQAQACHDSWILFYILYIWYYLKALPQNRYMKNAAYYLNPFEIEAYQHMDDTSYLERLGKAGATEWKQHARMTPAERRRIFYPQA